MYRVLLAEDEPAAMRYLRTLIESHFREFSIVASASNGREALELVQGLSPDLVLTDVKMPLMDGLELVKRLTELAPQTPAVIVSGYEDFEYVRRALNTGVVDYVLKPVTARRLSDVFQRIGGLLRRNADARVLSSLKRLLAGAEESSEQEIAFRLAVVRYGAPPSRFAHETGIRLAEECRDGICALHGRDDHETLLVAQEDRGSAGGFRARCASAVDSSTGVYHTLLVRQEAVLGGRLRESVEALYRDVDRAIVLGCGQVVEKPVVHKRPASLERVLASRIENAVINSCAGDLEELIGAEVSAWAASRVPVLRMLAEARKILEAIQRVALRAVEGFDIDSALEQAVARAQTFAEFGSSLCAIARRVGSLEAGAGGFEDSPALFAAIRSYLDSSYAHRHTIESVRARFRISTSYLTRLFRTNTGLSFTEYLRQLRIEAAKRLLRDGPAMPVKNVARFVGFRDPFYFSRVFRSVTGETPTQFLKNCRSSE